MVRAKFRVDRITIHPGNREARDSNGNRTGKLEACEMFDIEMNPVYSDDPNSENKAFWEATPCGSLTLSTINEDAAKQFKVWQGYYLDFTPALKEE